MCAATACTYLPSEISVSKMVLMSSSRSSTRAKPLLLMKWAMSARHMCGFCSRNTRTTVAWNITFANGSRSLSDLHHIQQSCPTNRDYMLQPACKYSDLKQRLTRSAFSAHAKPSDELLAMSAKAAITSSTCHCLQTHAVCVCSVCMGTLLDDVQPRSSSPHLRGLHQLVARLSQHFYQLTSVRSTNL